MNSDKDQCTGESELQVERRALIHQNAVLEETICKNNDRLKAIRKALQDIRSAQKDQEAEGLK